MAWAVEQRTGTAAELHAVGLPSPCTRLVRTLEVTAPALVLGSAQAPIHTDEVEVVRRHSGGGAVLVEPGRLVWVDVAIPRDDPLWDDDVGRAFHWLGQAWAAAVSTLGVVGPEVHRGGLVRSPLSDLVCFAGLGPGEVTVAGAKLVGMAQRRTREGALFQCAVPLAWDPDRMAGLLGLDHLDIPVLALKGRTPGEVTHALLASIPA